MKNFDMKRARQTLTRAVEGVDPYAVDYINWEAFEIELEAVMQAELEGQHKKAATLAVFSKAVNMARTARAQDRTIIRPN